MCHELHVCKRMCKKFFPWTKWSKFRTFYATKRILKLSANWVSTVLFMIEVIQKAFTDFKCDRIDTNEAATAETISKIFEIFWETLEAPCGTLA